MIDMVLGHGARDRQVHKDVTGSVSEHACMWLPQGFGTERTIFQYVRQIMEVLPLQEDAKLDRIRSVIN